MTKLSVVRLKRAALSVFEVDQRSTDCASAAKVRSGGMHRSARSGWPRSAKGRLHRTLLKVERQLCPLCCRLSQVQRMTGSSPKLTRRTTYQYLNWFRSSVVLALCQW
jgi:hypothetical protein